MKTLFKLTVIVLCLSFYNCKKETASIITFDYKYVDTENKLNCTDIDTKLFNEALLSFEDDIIKFYSKRNGDPRIAYTTFFRNNLGNRVDFNEVVSPHSMKIFDALKNQTNLWNSDNTRNYNAEIYDCLSSNFTDKRLATTFNSLVSINSMSLELFGAPLQNQIKNANSDRYLSTFIALDMYYSNLFNIDPTKVTEKKDVVIPTKTTPIKPSIKTKKAEDSHEGHNH